MTQIYTDIIDTFITVGIPCIIGVIIAAAKHFIGAQKVTKIVNDLQAKSCLAADAVKFAEDAFTELGGAEKLENAKKDLISRLNQYGISVTEDESDTLVRAAYQIAKAALSADVAKVATT
jgi:phosphoenolpyruvate carboxylase